MSVSLRIVLVFSILFLNTHPAHSKGANQDKSKAKAKGTVRTNRLAKETSPYLLAHAHNPVDWYPWGPEALEKAKSEDKPIFLSVGYSSCHWCHVMEKKVFSDEEIAAYMNEHFVNIKVDREERPDIDDIYMTSLQVYYSLIGNPQSGGWPLSMFLTPEGKPLGGATYLPPKTDDGSTSFPELMENVVANWTDAERRKKFESNADILTRAVQESFRRAPVLSPVSIDEKLVSKTLAALQQSFDSEKGGFGFSIRAPNRPKFPTPPKLEFLLSVAQNPTHEKSARRMLALTLDRMGAGGIYDHIGGGFHRYSTDRSWRIPHFEKMLYDNAQLAAVYTAAFELTKNRRYQTIAEETIGFVLRELTDPKGGFYSALDADSEGVEGKYYAWTTEQLQEILNADELAICQQVYGAAGRPNFEEGHVLQFVDSLEESAEALKLDTEELEQRLDPIRKKLLRERLRRKAPPRDDKILCGWNGLMIAALADAAVVFNRPEYLRDARTAAEFILKDMRQENGRLFRTYCVGEARIDAYLEDYAMLIHGLLALERATRDERYANAARRLTDLQLTLFWDDKAAGCFATSTSHEKLLVRTKPAYDSVTPSGNTVTVRNLLEIAAISGEAGYRKKADAALAEFAPTLDESPTSMANLATAIAESLTTNRKPSEPSNRKRDAEPTDDQDNDRSGRDQSQRGSRSNTDGRVVQVADKGESKPQPASKKKKVLDRINAKVFFAADPLPPGKSTKVLVQVTVDEGWHIHSNPPGDPDVDIATEITADSELGLELKSVKFPPGRIVPREEGPDARYLDGKVAVFGVLTVPAEAAGNEEELVVEIRYQACNDSQCLQPRTLKVPVTVAVAKRVNDSRPANEKLFNSAPSSERGAGKARRGE